MELDRIYLSGTQSEDLSVNKCAEAIGTVNNKQIELKNRIYKPNQLLMETIDLSGDEIKIALAVDLDGWNVDAAELYRYSDHATIIGRIEWN